MNTSGSLIGSWLCRLGFHKWGKGHYWYEQVISISPWKTAWLDSLWSKCERKCGAYQMRDSKGRIVGGHGYDIGY